MRKVTNGDNTDNIINGSGVDGEGDGTSIGDDHVNGQDGDDLIEGLGGNDFLNGGPGDDTIIGGDGIDVVRGGEGNDIIITDGADDDIRSAAQDDCVDSGAGHDTVNTAQGSDTVIHRIFEDADLEITTRGPNKKNGDIYQDSGGSFPDETDVLLIFVTEDQKEYLETYESWVFNDDGTGDSGIVDVPGFEDFVNSKGQGRGKMFDFSEFANVADGQGDELGLFNFFLKIQGFEQIKWTTNESEASCIVCPVPAEDNYVITEDEFSMTGATGVLLGNKLENDTPGMGGPDPLSIESVVFNDFDLTAGNLQEGDVEVMVLGADALAMGALEVFQLDIDGVIAYILTFADGDEVLINENDAFGVMSAGQMLTFNFDYTITEGHRVEDCPPEDRTAPQTVKINGINDCPDAHDDSAIIGEDDSVTVGPGTVGAIFLGNKLTGEDGTAEGLTANYEEDTDIDGDLLSIYSVVSDGFTLMPDSGALTSADISIALLGENFFGEGSLETFEITTADNSDGDLADQVAYIQVFADGREFLLNTDDAFAALGEGQMLTFNFEYTITDGVDADGDGVFDCLDHPDSTANQTVKIVGDVDLEIPFASNIVLYADDGDEDASDIKKIKFEFADQGLLDGANGAMPDGFISIDEMQAWLDSHSDWFTDMPGFDAAPGLIAFSIHDGNLQPGGVPLPAEGVDIPPYDPEGSGGQAGNNNLILGPGEGQLVWLDGSGFEATDSDLFAIGTDVNFAEDGATETGFNSDVLDDTVLDVRFDEGFAILQDMAILGSTVPENNG
ncbi:MAG: hypothetical protein ABFQ95_06350 [Pseudomonadota bacterium]